LSGRIWMPLQRETQRLSDFMNQREGDFVALVTPIATHLINSGAVVSVQLRESAGAPLTAFDPGSAEAYAAELDGEQGESAAASSRPPRAVAPAPARAVPRDISCAGGSC